MGPRVVFNAAVADSRPAFACGLRYWFSYSTRVRDTGERQSRRPLIQGGRDQVVPSLVAHRCHFESSRHDCFC